MKAARGGVVTAEPHFGGDVAVRSNGQIKWAGELIFVGEALVGEPVGILETEGGDWLARYADVELGYIHRQRPGIVLLATLDLRCPNIGRILKVRTLKAILGKLRPVARPRAPVAAQGVCSVESKRR
jgi:hypothetical protein